MKDRVSRQIMPCPVCRAELRLAERQGIEIDVCPNCRGVWLDRGELDKIVERSAGFADGPRHDTVVEGQYTAREAHPRRRKSWIEELFD